MKIFCIIYHRNESVVALCLDDFSALYIQVKRFCKKLCYLISTNKQHQLISFHLLDSVTEGEVVVI